MNCTSRIAASFLVVSVIHMVASHAAASVIIDFAGITDAQDMTSQTNGTTDEVAVSYAGDLCRRRNP